MGQIISRKYAQTLIRRGVNIVASADDVDWAN